MEIRISILMGIYNCEATLAEAIDSIINQTYSGWKLIMCDDGSNDRTYEIAESYREKYPDKIILVKNEINKGLNFTLNHCLKYADTEYVARMDGDDISLPTRLEKEISFLDKHPEYAIVSCPMIYFDEKGEWGRGKTNGEPTKESLAKETPFCHAPCMVRKYAFMAVDGYTVDKKLLRMEDYHFWIKMFSMGYRGFNLKEPLYKMRDDRNATKRRSYRYRINEARVRYLAVKKLKLARKNYIYVIRPLVVGLMPERLYEYLHRKRLA
ncbi:MAG: glycosyltransferase [Peptoniphilus sp.]|nr:glycosyltransferase [Peptoniphilus sp.]